MMNLVYSELADANNGTLMNWLCVADETLFCLPRPEMTWYRIRPLWVISSKQRRVHTWHVGPQTGTDSRCLPTTQTWSFTYVSLECTKPYPPV